MLTFTSPSAGSVKISGPAKPIIIFPAKVPTTDDVIALCPAPVEQALDTVISWPGEYNLSAVTVRGIGHEEGQQVSFVIDTDEVRIGCISQPLTEWTEKQMEAAGDLDVLILSPTDAKMMQKLVDEFDPRIVFLLPTDKQTDIDAAVKILGLKETLDEYKLKGLPVEGREVYVLTA
jgi:hypothetical protein